MSANGTTRAMAAIVGILTFALTAGPVSGQQPTAGPQIMDRSQRTQENAGPIDRMLLQKQRKALNHLRQKLIVADTNKLLKLAQELDSATAQNGKGMTSSARLKKLEEIQKLAKRVRERMSYPLWSSTTSLMSPASSMIP